MSDPTGHDPNYKDITECDPNIPEPKCGVCGVPWVSHMGIMGVCLWNKALSKDLVNLGKDNAQLYKERDEARREVCYAECVVGAASGERYTPQGIAEIKGWDCFKNQETT